MATINTTDPKPGYVYDSSNDTWYPLVGIAPGSSVYRWRKTAAGSETSFTGLDDLGATLSYNAGTEQVYLNGVLLVRTEDYLATTGTSVTSLSALTASDVIEVISFNATNIQVTDALLKTDINAKGDLIAGASAATKTILPVGTEGQVLKVNSTTTSGLEWGTDNSYSAPTLGSTSIASGSTVTTIAGLTLTSPTISTITNSGTVTLPTSTDTLVGRATTDTLTNKTLTKPILVAPMERTSVSTSAATSTVNLDVNTAGTLYITASSTSNWTLNVRGDGSTTLNSLLTTGDSMTVAFLATQGSTAYYPTALNIDGNAVTPKWQG